MMAQPNTAGLILREAYAQGAFGATSEYVWFLTDSVTVAISTTAFYMMAGKCGRLLESTFISVCARQALADEA